VGGDPAGVPRVVHPEDAVVRHPGVQPVEQGGAGRVRHQHAAVDLVERVLDFVNAVGRVEVEHDADLRARAYQELYRVYGEDGAILGQIYQTIVRDWHNEEVDMRHFSSPMSARNLGNDLPDEVIDTLLKVSEKNTALFQRFFQLKARLLGVKKLRRYDIYAPIAISDKRYDFKQATDKVFASFSEFDPKFETLAKRVFNDDHIDSEVRKGKDWGGASRL